jgi:23S rRNA (adenine2503-C2)-methyltransferase
MASVGNTTDQTNRADLCGFDREGLTAFLARTVGADEPAARRIFKQIWQRGARSVGEMQLVKRSLREAVGRVGYVSRLETDLVLKSTDGTTKFLWKLHDGHTVESVLIPDGDRLTLCMSTQVGCAMGCTFCLTGDLGLLRHLTVAEIALQPMQVQATLPRGTRITNLVLMAWASRSTTSRTSSRPSPSASTTRASCSPTVGSRCPPSASCRRWPSSPPRSR